MESTSDVFAFEVGAVAFGADGFCGAGEGWVAGFWALAHTELSPKQSVKTAAMSFLMANNLTPMQPNSQTPGFYGDGALSVLPDVGAHGRFLIRMLPLPPLQVVQIAAEREGCPLHRGNGDAIVDGRPTLAAPAPLNEFRRNQAVPGNTPVMLLINAGRIDRANGIACMRVPVLAVDPMVAQHGDAAYLAE